MSQEGMLRFYERQFGPFVHMAPLDKAIWLRYLEQGGVQFAPFQYDINVGAGVQMPHGSNDIAVRMAEALTTKRIDALCMVDGRARIIEVKQRAGLAAVGQMIGYKHLYDLDKLPGSPAEMLLVTDYLQPDMKPILIANNIGVVEVGL